jgi:hypothetical protein
MAKGKQDAAQLGATARHPEGRALTPDEGNAWAAWVQEYGKKMVGMYALPGVVYFVGQGRLDLGAVAVAVPVDQLIGLIDNALMMTLGAHNAAPVVKP